ATIATARRIDVAVARAAVAPDAPLADDDDTGVIGGIGIDQTVTLRNLDREIVRSATCPAISRPPFDAAECTETDATTGAAVTAGTATDDIAVRFARVQLLIAETTAGFSRNGNLPGVWRGRRNCYFRIAR